MQKTKGSVYILVLILLMVSVLFVGVLYKGLNLNILQFSLEKKTAQLERILESGLDRATREYTSNPTTFLQQDEISLTSDYGICGEDPNLYDADQRCSTASKIIVDKINQILGYLTQNGETLQVMLSTPPSAPRTGADALIEVHTNPNQGGDTLLATAYFYDSGQNTIRVRGSCVVNYSSNGSSVDSTSCLGPLTATQLTPQNAHIDTYGAIRVRIRPTGSNSVSFYRLKMLTNGSEPVYLSVTGPNYIDLPELQQVVLKGVAYSISSDASKAVNVTMSRSIMAQPSFPEVFDWALFNGSDQSIVK